MNTSADMQTSTYPVQFSVDYPDRALNKTSTAFRAFSAESKLSLTSRSSVVAVPMKR